MNKYSVGIIDGSWMAKKNFQREGQLVSRSMSEVSWLKDSHKCGSVIVLWDGARSKLIRQEINPTYKDGRSSWPAEYYEQVRQLRTMLRCTAVDQYFPVESEADDGAWTLTRDSNGRKLLYSCDKDWYQCVNESTDFFRLVLKPKLYTAESPGIEPGIAPAQWPIFQALTGDMVDNIIGVPGIGPVKAARLCKEYPELLDEILFSKGKTNASLLSDMLDDDSLSTVIENSDKFYESYLMTRMYEVDMDIMEGERDAGLLGRLMWKWTPDLLKYSDSLIISLFTR